VKSGQRVYFIKPVGMDGPIKIGCSDKPDQRLLVLAAWSPFELEIIGSVPGSFKDENALHRRFANLHTRKEWFMSSPLLRQTIERILAGTSIAEACKDLAEKGAIRGQKRPAKTPDRKLFLEYGNRIRSAVRALWRAGEGGRWEKPQDVAKIMHDWRCDKVHGHSPITPTPEQFARLDEFLADPKKYARFIEWKPIVKTPICVPHIEEVAA
jgi:hypothetical protein